MARARPAAASSSGRPSYAESFASRRRRQARAPANQQTTKNEQGVPHATGCVWRHGLSDVAREETEDNQEDAEEGSCMRHWHNLQKCRDLQNMNLERHIMGTPCVDLWAEFEDIASGVVPSGQQGQQDERIQGQGHSTAEHGRDEHVAKVATGDGGSMQLGITVHHHQSEVTEHDTGAGAGVESLAGAHQDSTAAASEQDQTGRSSSPERRTLVNLAFLHSRSCAPASCHLTTCDCDDTLWTDAKMECDGQEGGMENRKTEPAEIARTREPVSCFDETVTGSEGELAGQREQREKAFVGTAAPRSAETFGRPVSSTDRSVARSAVGEMMGSAGHQLGDVHAARAPIKYGGSAAPASMQARRQARMHQTSGCTHDAAARPKSGRGLPIPGCHAERPTNAAPCSELDASRKFRSRYLALVGGTDLDLALKKQAVSLKPPQACESKQAKIAKGLRFLRAMVQRLGVSPQGLEKTQSGKEGLRGALRSDAPSSRAEKSGEYMAGLDLRPALLFKLHRFAWGCVEVSDTGIAMCSTDSRPQGDQGAIQDAEACRDALSQYMAASRGCPGVLRPLNSRRSNGLIGRIVRRILRTWYGNAAFRLVAIGFRSIRLILTCFTKLKHLAMVRVCLERLCGGKQDALCNQAYAGLLPNLARSTRARPGSVRGWSSMQDTVLRLILIAYDASLALSAEDQMLLKSSALACKLRWTSTALQHLRAWFAWLQHPWRLMRFRFHRRIFDEYLAEWRAWTQCSRENQARGTIQLWKREVLRINDIAAYEKRHACLQRRRYQASFFNVLACDLARKRAFALLASVPRKITHSWHMSKWRLRSGMVHRAANFAAMRSWRIRQQIWEEWSIARWTRRRHLSLLFGAWAAHVYSDLTQRKRGCKKAGALLFSRQSRRRLRRGLAKWRLLAAVGTYALHLILATCVRGWHNAVQGSCLENRRLRVVYRTRFARKMLHKWLETTVHVARHRAWKAHVRVARQAHTIQAFRDTCTRQGERRRRKKNAIETASAYHARIFLNRYLPGIVSLWTVLATRGKHVRCMRVQIDVRMKRRILVLFARSVCVKYMIIKCLRSQMNAALGAWREMCAATKWFQSRGSLIRARAGAAQRRMVVSFLAARAARSKTLSKSAKAVSTKFATSQTSRNFRSWQAAAARQAMLNDAHDYLTHEHQRRNLQGLLRALAEHSVVRCAKRIWSSNNAAAEARRTAALCSDVIEAWHEFARDSRRQALVYHACKHACMQELILRSARRQCATLQGIVLLLHHALFAWQSAASKALARRRLALWQ